MTFKYVIEPKVKKCGYEKPLRSDHDFNPSIIKTSIIQHIRNDDLVIAVLSGSNPNVFYELSIRHAIMKPCVHIIDEASWPPPFDVSAMNIIKYDLSDCGSPEKTIEELIKDIKSTEEEKVMVNHISSSLAFEKSIISDDVGAKNIAILVEQMQQALYENRQIVANLQKYTNFSSPNNAVNMGNIGYQTGKIINNAFHQTDSYLMKDILKNPAAVGAVSLKGNEVERYYYVYLSKRLKLFSKTFYVAQPFFFEVIYVWSMTSSQLLIFQRKTYKGIIPSLPMGLQTPTPDRSVLQVLPAYYTYLKDGGFSKYTPDDFTGDVKKFGVFCKEKYIQDIAAKDVQAWISQLRTPSPKGEGLSAKTVSRKLSALGNFFHWLVGNLVIQEERNPMRDITHTRISSPLPEVLFEEECKRLLAAPSGDPRTYLLCLLFLEVGIKSEELFALKVSNFDFSNKYAPEVHVKHAGNKEKESRKLKMQMEIITVFNDYVATYKIDDLFFPYTQRFVQYLIVGTSEKAGVKKRVSAQILRDTCAVRQLKRGEQIERVLERLGLSETTWEDAKEKYLKLAKAGIKIT